MAAAVLAVVHPKTLAKNSAEWAQFAQDYRGQVVLPVPKGASMPQFPDRLDRSEIMVWQQPDFDREVEAAKVAHDRVVQLSFTFKHHAADRRRASLLADPQIQRRYNHRLAENTP